VEGMSLIAHDVAFGHFRSEIAHAICSKKKKKNMLYKDIIFSLHVSVGDPVIYPIKNIIKNITGSNGKILLYNNIV
jgi:hypothetical protein